MSISKIRNEIKPELDLHFKCEIEYVDELSEPILVILDNSPDHDKPLVSFAFGLECYDEGEFPRKFWCSCSSMKSIDGKCPSPNDSYSEFEYHGVTFYPFSVDLSNYSSTDPQSVRQLVNNLYEHIEHE